jgi:four helix bundle protein
MKLEEIAKNPILNLSFEFSLAIIEYCAVLENNKQFVIAKQLLQSGTSIGANAMEAQNAASKADFIHKFKNAAKEANETQYWLLLCMQSSTYSNCENLLNKIENINKLLTSILASSKRKNPISYLLRFFM